VHHPELGENQRISGHHRPSLRRTIAGLSGFLTLDPVSQSRKS
jgi:hypothetical protein